MRRYKTQVVLSIPNIKTSRGGGLDSLPAHDGFYTVARIRLNKQQCAGAAANAVTSVDFIRWKVEDIANCLFWF